MTLVALSALSALTMAACKPKEQAAGEAPAPPVHVDTVEAKPRPVPQLFALTGTLRGMKQTELAANASGRVLETMVERGSEVKQGDVIAKLDVRIAALNASEARASAELQRITAVSAKRECERYEKLLAQNAISPAEYDRVSDQCKTSGMSIAAAQARANQAAQVVSDGIVRAPFAGLVTERYVEVGEYVRQDSKVISLISIDQLRLEFTVPEVNLSLVKQGGELTFTVPSYGDRVFKGTVRFVSASVREATRDLVAEALVDNADRALRPGMFATISLNTGTAPAPVIPKTATFDKDGRPHAYVVVGGRLEERVVQVTPLGEGELAVSRGINGGEQVVQKPAPTLRNGQAVN